MSELDGKKGVLQNELNLLEEKSVAAEKEYNEAKQRRESVCDVCNAVMVFRTNNLKNNEIITCL